MNKPTSTALLLGFLVFLVNPGIGCSTDDHQFGDAEMQAAVVGTWRLTAPDVLLEVVLRPGPGAATAEGPTLIRPAAACGTRTFVRSAAACIDVSVLYLEGHVTEGSEQFKGAALKGDFHIFGTEVRPGRLSLSLPDGSELTFETVDATGSSFVGAWSKGATPETVRVTFERLWRGSSGVSSR